MSACIMAQGPQIMRNHNSSFRRKQPCAVCLCVLDPVTAHLTRVRYTRVLVQKYQRVAVVCDAGRFSLNTFFEIGHNHVDARGQCLGLAGLQIMCQPCHIGVVKGCRQHCGLGQQACPHDSSIREISKRFQVLRARQRISGCIRHHLVDQPVADRVQHRLMFTHRIDDRRWIMGLLERKLGHGRDRAKVRQTRCPRQKLAWIMPHVHGAVLVRKETYGHFAALPRRSLAQV